MYRNLSNYFKNPDFSADNVAKVSEAAGNLCKWVEAMKSYYEVYREVEPLKKELAQATK